VYVLPPTTYSLLYWPPVIYPPTMFDCSLRTNANKIKGIKYEDLAYGALHGFASAGSNNGHNGTSGTAFYQNPEVVIDYSWRAYDIPSSLHLIKLFHLFSVVNDM
jgi:hypothetical protein